jgi:AraC-like DNA-binding protein
MNTNLIRATSIQWAIKQLRHSGIEASRLLANTHLKIDWIDNKDAFIPYTDYQQIIINSLDATGDNALGLQIGKTATPIMFDSFGYAIISSKTLKDAFNVYLKYQDLSCQLTHVSMTINKNECMVQVDPAYPFKDRVLVYIIEEALSNLHNTSIFLLNQEPKLKEVGLSYKKPEHIELYREMFHCPLRFMAQRNYLLFDARYLKIPISSSNPSVHIFCTRHCEEMLKDLKKSDPFIEEIRNVILSTPGQFPKTNEAAKALGMGTRSMQRKLKERKTSYKKILDEIRSTISMRYLENTNLTVDQISDLVGFSETRALRKAFTTWVGKSPSQYRKEIMQN